MELIEIVITVCASRSRTGAKSKHLEFSLAGLAQTMRDGRAALSWRNGSANIPSGPSRAIIASIRAEDKADARGSGRQT